MVELGGDTVCLCPYCVVNNAFVVLRVCLAPLLLLLLLFSFFLVLFFFTPLSFCVALYHGAGLGPCSLDPFCFLASWLTPAHIGCCQPGAWLRGKVFRKLRSQGSLPPHKHEGA